MTAVTATNKTYVKDWPLLLTGVFLVLGKWLKTTEATVKNIKYMWCIADTKFQQLSENVSIKASD